jgi:hypothetical protein
MQKFLGLFFLICLVLPVDGDRGNLDQLLKKKSKHMPSPIWRSSKKTVEVFISGNTFSRKKVKASEIDGLPIFEGDIVLHPVGEVEISPRSLSANRSTGVAITGQKYRWPSGKVPFEIAGDLPQQERVLDAIKHWEAHTPIRFEQHTNQSNYVVFVPGGGCSSKVGMHGGRQNITLAPTQAVLDEGGSYGTCLKGHVIHEIGHALGLWHEQSREDRDKHIEILWDNIKKPNRHNFNQHITDGDDVGSYDFGSIMHYSSRAFGKDDDKGSPLQTIEVRDGKTKIGQHSRLSKGDIDTIYEMYNFLRPVKPDKPGSETEEGDQGKPTSGKQRAFAMVDQAREHLLNSTDKEKSKERARVLVRGALHLLRVPKKGRSYQYARFEAKKKPFKKKTLKVKNDEPVEFRLEVSRETISKVKLEVPDKFLFLKNSPVRIHSYRSDSRPVYSSSGVTRSAKRSFPSGGRVLEPKQHLELNFANASHVDLVLKLSKGGKRRSKLPVSPRLKVEFYEEKLIDYSSNPSKEAVKLLQKFLKKSKMKTLDEALENLR